MTPTELEATHESDKWVLHEIKNPLHSRENHQQSKQPTGWGSVLTSYTSDRRLYLEYITEKIV